MSDHPFDLVLESATARVNEGWTVFQKFTCGGCGARQTMDVPNAFYERGICEECGHETDIRAAGCNFMSVIGALTADQFHGPAN